MRLLLVTGTGGAGTSTVAAATALHAARRGVKTLLLPLDGDGVPPALEGHGGPRAAVAPVELEPGLAVHDAGARARARRAAAGLAGPLAQLAGALGVDPLDELELPALPLVDEVTALLELRDAAAGGWDLVVVDAPAPAALTGLVALPGALGRAVERLLPVERRMVWAMGHAARAGSGPAPARGLVLAAERLDTELDGVREVLAAPGTAVRLVLAPDPSAVARAARARTALALHGLAVDAVVAPRLVPGGDDPWRARRAHEQDAVLADAARLFDPVPVLRAAERAGRPGCRDDLADLAAELYGDTLPWASGEPAAPAAPVVEPDGEGYVLVLRLPGASATDVALARRGDDLLLDVAGQRRALRLPSGLRRCETTTAAVRDGVLRIGFRPDPALWRAL